MTSPRSLLVPALVLGLVLLGACSSGEQTHQTSSPTPARPDAPRPQNGPYPAQSGWVEEAPANGMRKAQFRLPGADGAADASLVVYSFPSGAGTLEANFERWAGQFEQPDGSSTLAAAARSTRTRGDLTIHYFEVGGRYVAERMPGSDERLDEPDWRMLAAIVEGAGDPAYVKLVGPAPTVARWEPSYRTFIEAVDPDRAP